MGTEVSGALRVSGVCGPGACGGFSISCCLPGRWLCLLCLVLMLCPGRDALAGLYADQAAILEAIRTSPLDGEPVHPVSVEERGAVHGEVHAILDAPFEALVRQLDSAEAWCEIFFLHFNIKACVLERKEAHPGQEIRLHIGRKRYQDPEVVERLGMRFEAQHLNTEAFLVRLQAERGPHGLRDLSLELSAMRLDAERSLLRMRYALRYGALGRMTLALYFSVGGRDRIGFTVEGVDEAGQPVHVSGMRGMIERNTLRFYFALKAYLREPGPARLEQRLIAWFELTERHPEQLREMPLGSYVAQKLREHHDQVAIQARIDAGIEADIWAPSGGW